jgi:hypothetical protein
VTVLGETAPDRTLLAQYMTRITWASLNIRVFIVSAAMKNFKLIDIVPSIFGVAAMVGLITTMRHLVNPRGGLLLLLGNGLACLVTALISVIMAKLRHSFTSIHVVNLIVVLIVAGFLVFMISSFYSLTFSF